ncbi:MAG: 4Fe-4S binding protein [Porphyromonadaceae bacterium]|nr:4Fe-4S binding protein [Porphyromonadaceae bacterium]
MAKIKGTVVVDTERCKGCDLCVQSCPQSVLELNAKVNSKGYHYSTMVKEDDCIGCTACAMVCPDAVISVYRVKTND